jgi:NADPH:quinone reductase-like Zn-dependent oxidoreductase
MKVIEARGFGIDKLAIVERPEPTPGPHEVLVRIRACSLNYRDLLILRGEYDPKQRFPLVLLCDGAGEVVEVGAEVTRVKRGDRVATIFMQQWISGELTDDVTRSALGGGIDGVAAEYVTLHEDGLVHVPEHLSFEEAATLPCAAVTAWNALFESGRVKFGDTVLVLGSGGVSLFALQFARLAGARVIATSSSDAKLERLKQLGASECINYKTTPEWGARAQNVDHVIEVGGAGTFSQSLRAVRRGGTISLIGVLAGFGDVNPLPVLMKGVRVNGIYVGSREMFERMNRAITVAKLQPVIDRVFSMDEIGEALRYMESGSHFGKVVVRLTD